MTDPNQTRQEIIRGRKTAPKRLESSAKDPLEGSSSESAPLHTTPTSAKEDEGNNEGSESNDVLESLNEISTASAQSTTPHPYPWTYATTTLEAAFEGKPIAESVAAQSQPPPQGATTTYTYHFKDAKHMELGPLYNVGDDLEEDDDDHGEDVQTTTQGTPSSAQLGALPAVESYVSSAIAQRATSVIQAFLAHGDACTAAEAEALKLATTPTSFVSQSREVVEDGDEEVEVNEPQEAETSSSQVYPKAQDPDGDSDSEGEEIFKRRDDIHEDGLEDPDTGNGDQSEIADKTPTQQHDDDEEEQLERKLQEFRDMLGHLEKLHVEAVDLEASLLELIGSGSRDEMEGSTAGPNPALNSESSSNASNSISATAMTTTAEEIATSQFAGVVKACLPVMKARIANLEMALELLDSAQENLTITYKMESLGL